MAVERDHGMTRGELVKMFLSLYAIICGAALSAGALPVWRAVVAWVRGTGIDTDGLDTGLMFLALAALMTGVGGRLLWRTMHKVLERAERQAAQDKAEAARSPALQTFNERLDVFTTRLNYWLMGWLAMFLMSLLGGAFFGEYHWVLGIVFIAWTLGLLLGFVLFSWWIERRLCRKLGLMCPHCRRPVIITSRRREEQPEPVECQRCGADLHTIFDPAAAPAGTPS